MIRRAMLNLRFQLPLFFLNGTEKDAVVWLHAAIGQ
jgi:hypothetical protein